MALISTLTLEDMISLHDEIAESARRCSSLEEAAQAYMSILYENLSESIVLARIFATIPYMKLPEDIKGYVTNQVDLAGVSDKLKDTTLVLTLLGTRGADHFWDDRHNSRGHVGIPLVSRDFIDSMPMPVLLLRQLGIDLDWIDDDNANLILRTSGRLSGVFYVQDAGSEIDEKNRRIITSEDFVNQWKVKTVFGIGGSYLGSTTIFTTVIFVRETLERDIVDRFMLQADKFKTATMGITYNGKIFS